ncbi:MAG: metallophosphoesterase [Bacteroidales bacterium]|nr:metallophosphoesterase [Candidatus Physcousia equi]
MLLILIALAITWVLIAVSVGLAWILCRIIRRKKRIRYRRFGLTTIALGALATVLILYGFFWGRWDHEVREWDYDDPRLPAAFDGYRIVHISDLHLEGYHDRPEQLDSIVAVINSLQPDLICFTGDLVSFNHKGLLPHITSLQRLQAKDGGVSVLGNHDYGIYDRSLDSMQREDDRAQLIRLQRGALHWKLLLNEHIMLHRNGDSLRIAGVENQACGLHQKVRRGKLDHALRQPLGCVEATHDAKGDATFTILLSHDPSHWDAEVVGATNIPLTLSGHTHAMQITFCGLAPSRLLFRRSDGAYREGQQQLYVNIGLGALMPFRIGATPEITLITLHKKP